MGASPLHKAVRNVICNELGLNKSEIDKQIKQMVREELQRAFSGGLEGHIHRVIDDRIKARNYHLSEDIKKAVAEHVKAQVDGVLEDKLTITIATR